MIIQQERWLYYKGRCGLKGIGVDDKGVEEVWIWVDDIWGGVVLWGRCGIERGRRGEGWKI